MLEMGLEENLRALYGQEKRFWCKKKFLRVCTKFLLPLTLLDSGYCTIYPFSSLICWPHGLLTMFTKDLACGSWSFDLPHDSSIILNNFNPSRHLRGRQVFGLLSSGDFQLHLYCATQNHKHTMAYRHWNFLPVKFQSFIYSFILQMPIEYLPCADHCASHCKSSYS